MSRREKQYQRLEILEREFREVFVAELGETARSSAIWCYVTRTLESYQTEGWFRSHQQTHLLERVEEIEGLRSSLGEPIVGTLCERYREFCRALHNGGDEQRLGPRRLAAQLLETLSSE